MSKRLDAARDALDRLTSAWIGAAVREDEAERLALIEPLTLAAEEYLAALGGRVDLVDVYLLDEPNVDRPPLEDEPSERERGDR